MDEIIAPGDVSGDPILRLPQGVGILLILIHHLLGVAAIGMNKADFSIFLHHDKGDMAVESDDSDARPTGFHFL